MCANDDELRREVASLLQSGQDVALVDRAATEKPSTFGLLEGRAIGSQIGVFRLDAWLGVGGMGEVSRSIGIGGKSRIRLTRRRGIPVSRPMPTRISVSPVSPHATGPLTENTS